MPSNIIRIDDPADPRLSAYRDIRERDLVGRQGRFVAEGKVVLRVLFAARRFTAESALILEGRLAGAQDVLALAPPEMPIYVGPQEVIDALAGFHLHRGILAIGAKRQPLSADELLATLPESATVLALIGISNHDNVGAIFRNAACFDCDAVLLDRTSCDPLYRKAIRVSVGASLKVPFATCSNEGELFASLRATGFEQIALTPGGQVEIADVTPAKRMAIYLGSEGTGLPGELMERMTTARIAMSDSFDSLNVAAASAIALHRFWRRR